MSFSRHEVGRICWGTLKIGLIFSYQGYMEMADFNLDLHGPGDCRHPARLPPTSEFLFRHRLPRAKQRMSHGKAQPYSTPLTPRLTML
jgi:hypothetical protein